MGFEISIEISNPIFMQIEMIRTLESLTHERACENKSARTCARTHALALARLTLGGMMAEGKRKHNKRVAYLLLTSIADSFAQVKRSYSTVDCCSCKRDNQRS
jgi:hypothetical protein